MKTSGGGATLVAQQPFAGARSVRRKLRTATHALAWGANKIAEWLVLAMVLLFAYEVALRTFFKTSTGFADQASAYAMALITFLSLAYTQVMGGHVDADILVAKLSPRWRSRLGAVTDALSMIVAAALLWSSITTVLNSLKEGTKEMIGLWIVPNYLPQLIMPLGLGLLVLVILAELCNPTEEAVQGERP